MKKSQYHELFDELVDKIVLLTATSLRCNKNKIDRNLISKLLKLRLAHDKFEQSNFLSRFIFTIELLLIILNRYIAASLRISAYQLLRANSFRAAPGSKLIVALKFFYSKKKFEHVFEPAIADMREEYYEALQAGEKWHARWIHLRGVISIIMAMVADLPFSVFGLVIKIWTSAK